MINFSSLNVLTLITVDLRQKLFISVEFKCTNIFLQVCFTAVESLNITYMSVLRLMGSVPNKSLNPQNLRT